MTKSNPKFGLQIERMEKRALWAQVVGYLVFVGLVLPLLAYAGYVFIQAFEITARETGKIQAITEVERFDQLSLERVRVLEDLKNLEREVKQLQLELEQTAPDANSRIDRLKNSISNLLSARNNLIQNLEFIERQLEERNLIPESNETSVVTSVTMLNFIQGNITRFGTVAVIVFIVMILMGVYRYSMRLAAFYLSQADALHVLERGINIDQFEKISAAMAPTAEFGKLPETPMQTLVRASELLSKFKS